MVYFVGKVVVSKVFFMGKDDVEIFEKLKEKGVKFDVCKVFNDLSVNMEDIIKKVKYELKI